MPDYSIFGGRLRSEIAFPELRESSEGPVDWTLSTTPTAPSLADAESLGEIEITPSCRLRLFKHAGGFRLLYDDTGAYDVSRDGRRITWTPNPEAAPVSVRADVTGRVLATALHARGALCLHGSAVSLAGGTVAFLAPKYHGKSTLALALARAGGRLVTDDVLPVEPGDAPIALPGVHQVKLWDDTARLFGVANGRAAGAEKHLVHDFPDDRLMLERTRLDAIYLLVPVHDDAVLREAARRTRLGDVPAALSLVRHATLGELLGGSEAPVVFERAAAIARHVPVYGLEARAGLDRVPDVIAQILAWHAVTAPSSPIESAHR